MNPDLYCQEKVLERGSRLHHALVYAKPDERSALCALFALRREVRESIDASSDPSVAQARLAWWRDELERLFSGAPSHPVSHALAPHGQSWLARHERDLTDLLDAVAIELSQTRFIDAAGLESLAQRDYGALFRVSSAALSCDEESDQDQARELGVAYTLAEVLQRVGADARQGRIYLPVDELKKFAVPAGDILAGRPNAGLERLLEASATQVRARVAAVEARISHATRRRLRPLRILVTLSLRLLRECEKEHFKVLEHRLELTPLRASLVASGVWLGLTRPA